MVNIYCARIAKKFKGIVIKLQAILRYTWCTHAVYTFYYIIAHELKGTRIKLKTFEQVIRSSLWFMPLEFSNLYTRSATYTVIKMASQVEKAECLLWFDEHMAALLCKRDFIRYLEGNHQQRCRYASGMNCLIRLAAFVQGKEPRDDQSLKLGWMNFGRHSFAAHTNQPGILLGS
jgi:hypothetical protein